MTAPRRVLPGTTYLFTRRCSERRFLLTPSATTNAVFTYVLALAARRTGVQIHALCVLSNHVHMVLTDPYASLPRFAQYLGSLVARALNASIGHWESFWAPGSYSAVPLESPDEVVEKVAYVLANPVAAGLVRHGREWPGMWAVASGRARATELTAERPSTLFQSDGYMPERASLELTVPPGFTPEEFQRRVAAALGSLEDRCAVERSGRRGFVGVRKVLAQNPLARPAPREPRRNLNPRIAGRDKWKRLEAIHRLRCFLEAYREAWHALRAGVRDVVFPAGTYLMRVRFGVKCAEVT